MTKLQAQPYEISANGYYFVSAEEFKKRSNENCNDCDQPGKEYEIQFIDGDGIDAEFANTFRLSQ